MQKIKRKINIERLKTILSTINPNLIKKIQVKYISATNGYNDKYILNIGTIEYHIDTSALSPEKQQIKNEKIDELLNNCGIPIVVIN